MEDIVIPYLQLAALVILSFGPAIIIGFWRPGTPADTRTAQFVALGFGALFAPMGMLALAMFDSVAVLNPIALSWSILRVPLHYLVAAACFVAVLLLDGFAAGALRTLLPVPFLPGGDDLLSQPLFCLRRHANPGSALHKQGGPVWLVRPHRPLNHSALSGWARGSQQPQVAACGPRWARAA